MIHLPSVQTPCLNLALNHQFRHRKFYNDLHVLIYSEMAAPMDCMVIQLQALKLAQLKELLLVSAAVLTECTHGLLAYLTHKL